MAQLELLDLACDRFAELASTVSDEKWTNPTPCDEWDVAALVDHVIGGNVFTAAILGGRSAQDAMNAAHGAFEESLARRELLTRSLADQRRAFGEPGALERMCAHVAGDVPGVQVLGFRLIDLTVHGWDLAVGVGARADIDERLAEAVWSLIDPSMVATGLFGSGPSGTVPDGAPASVRVLDALGRRP